MQLLLVVTASSHFCSSTGAEPDAAALALFAAFFEAFSSLALSPHLQSDSGHSCAAQVNWHQLSVVPGATLTHISAALATASGSSSAPAPQRSATIRTEGSKAAEGSGCPP